jgi:hypothetical protein
MESPQFHFEVADCLPASLAFVPFVLMLALVNAGRMPKNVRRNLRIFNGLDIAGISSPASERETGSDWNTPRFQTKWAAEDKRELHRSFQSIPRI